VRDKAVCVVAVQLTAQKIDLNDGMVVDPVLLLADREIHQPHHHNPDLWPPYLGGILSRGGGGGVEGAANPADEVADKPWHFGSRYVLLWLEVRTSNDSK
jgi:hypothetical protein